MPNEYIGFRIDADIKRKLQKIAQDNRENVSDTVKRALSQFMAGDTDKPDVQALAARLNRLEAKFEKMNDSTHKPQPQKKKKSKSTPDKKERIDPDDLPDLITKKQAAAMTGFAFGSMGGKFSVNDISAQEQKGGNRAGLYVKQEVIDKIGFK